MSWRPLDSLLALKAITLSSEISGTEKQVAGVLIESFNRKTSQCDPSLGRIARLLNIDRRTVIRAVHKLEASRLFRKVRHGGKSQRNSYAPNWELFRALDGKWKAIFFAKRNYSGVTNVSPVECQPRHLAGDEGVTQTFLTNQSKKPSLIGPVSETIKEPIMPSGRKVLSGQDDSHIGSSVTSASGNRPINVIRAIAERRWNAALHGQYAANPAIYGEVIDAIDSAMQNAATEAEIKNHGAGLTYILKELEAQRNRQNARGPRGV